MARSIHDTDEYKKLVDSTLKPISNQGSILDIPYDDFLRFLQPYNSFNKALGTSLYGLNHRNVKTLTQNERDNQGYVFFTRPQLCMTDNNLKNDRRFLSLLVSDKNSIFRYIRNLLDPRLGTDISLYSEAGDVTGYGQNNVCPFLDNNNIFIAPFTNYITSCTGWPEPVIPTYKSQEDVRGGQWSMVDGIADINGVYDITCTFRNPKESPILLIAFYWSLYTTLVFSGVFNPYPDMIASNELDYNTRIWRILLDESKTKVKYIGHTGASTIKAPDIGKIFNYTEGNPLSEQNKEVSITFESSIACYQDPISIDEFNKTVGIANPIMREIRKEKLYNKRPNTSYIKIPKNLLDRFNFRGYPMIDYETNELEWFVSKNSPTYKRVISIVNSFNI